MNTEDVSPRQRLQELLAIPERQRTDAEWDEIVELEISLAPGNRGTPGASPTPSADPMRQQNRRHGGPGQPQQHRQNPGGQGKRPGKKFHRKPPRGNPPR